MNTLILINIGNLCTFFSINDFFVNIRDSMASTIVRPEAYEFFAIFVKQKAYVLFVCVLQQSYRGDTDPSYGDGGVPDCGGCQGGCRCIGEKGSRVS